MRGSTRKRGDTWTALWSVVDPATGKRLQESQGGFRTQKLAEAHVSTVLASVHQGTYIEPCKQLFGSWLKDKWLPAVRGELRPLTYESYSRIVKTHVLPQPIGQVPLRALNAGHLNALYKTLEDRGLAVGTRRLIHATLRRALNNAVVWDKIKTNPAAKANPPRQTASRAIAWSSREVRQFLESVRDDRLAALWRLAATTGMRRGELCGLRWQDVDLNELRLHVRQQVLPTPGQLTFGAPKSRRSARTIALDVDTAQQLSAHRELQQLERDLAGAAYGDRDLVFADQLGKPIRPTKLGDRFVELRKAASIPVGSLHTLRHTHITIALTEGVPVHVLAARAGDRPEQILSTYAHLLPHSDAEAAAVAAAIAPVDKALTSERAVAAGVLD